LDVNNENTTPEEKQYAPTPITKDALYGRRAYSKVIDTVFQEAYANSGSQDQREAIGGVSQAWAHLDQVDPQGEFLLLKAMVDRLQGDSRLAAALGISVTSALTPARSNIKASDSSLSGTTVNGSSTTRIRSSTTTTTMSSTAKSTSETTSTPDATPASTPISTPTGTAASYALKGPKLILAQNNPHLKSHRRRQSNFVAGEKGYGDAYSGIDEKKLPGYVQRGMEQQALLADHIFGDYLLKLRARWPMT
jgi:serine/threonine-protein kinase 24/25/MST4